MQQLIRIAALALTLLFAFPAFANQMPEGQNKADYLAWLAREPGARAEVLAFKQFLAMDEVEDVVPTWELVRTASMWRDCDGPQFDVAPPSEWPHIADTLSFIEKHVEPVNGPDEHVTGFRNDAQNRCAHGAPRSAHREFYALDMVPVGDLSRGELMRGLCRIHDLRGEQYNIGLGFYGGTRFHVDSQRFRRWGPDGKGATSPCNTGVFA
jgi:hypothetical protein